MGIYEMPYKDLGEHINTVIAIVIVLGTIVGALVGFIAHIFWKLIKTIEAKVSQVCHLIATFQRECSENRYECREELIKTLVTKEDFIEWKEGRKELWTAINRHEHDSKTGGVIRK